MHIYIYVNYKEYMVERTKFPRNRARQHSQCYPILPGNGRVLNYFFLIQLVAAYFFSNFFSNYESPFYVSQIGLNTKTFPNLTVLFVLIVNFASRHSHIHLGQKSES